MTLSSEQLAAVTSPLGRTIISAAAGAGKTTVLAERVAWLIARGEDPQTILAIVFTRHAAAVLRTRVAAACGPDVAEAVTVGNFHGLAASWTVRPHEKVASLEESDQILRGLYEGDHRRPARTLPGITELEGWVARHAAGEVVPDARTEGNPLGILLLRHREAGLVPLWDLIPRAVWAVARPDGPLYRHVLLDEAMDVTRHEGNLANALVVPGGTFTAVLDPRQRIFEWRHGFGIADQPTHRLTLSYRFGGTVAAEANRIAERMGAEPIEGLRSVGSQVVRTPILDEVRRIVAEDPSRTLVLARKHVAWSDRDPEWTCQRLAAELGHLAEHVAPPDVPLEASPVRFADAWARGHAVVTTVHAAKGAEADTVVVALADDEDPEELRVQYVAVTRARRRLVILEGAAA